MLRVITLQKLLVTHHKMEKAQDHLPQHLLYEANVGFFTFFFYFGDVITLFTRQRIHNPSSCLIFSFSSFLRYCKNSHLICPNVFAFSKLDLLCCHLAFFLIVFFHQGCQNLDLNLKNSQSYFLKQPQQSRSYIRSKFARI